MTIEPIALKQLPEPARVNETLARFTPRSFRGRRPDIYFIVAESFRPDLVTALTTPHLAQWKNRSPITEAYAASNCTHVSWFSLFHGQSPTLWSAISHQNVRERGAIPLQLLSRLGYRIRFFASPRLDYYSFWDSLTAGNQGLKLEKRDQTDYMARGFKRTADIDRQVMEDVGDESAKPHEPTLFVIFLNSTHHDYSWTANFVMLVPLYFSFPGKRKTFAGASPASHLDIFPTIADYLGAYDPVASLLPGRSLFRPHPHPTTLTAHCSNFIPHRYYLRSPHSEWKVELRKAVKVGRIVSAAALDVYLYQTLEPDAGKHELHFALDRLREDLAPLSELAGGQLPWPHF